jgi:hypothetical protein
MPTPFPRRGKASGLGSFQKFGDVLGGSDPGNGTCRVAESLLAARRSRHSVVVILMSTSRRQIGK